MRAETASPDDEIKTSFKHRLKAWWNGVDVAGDNANEESFDDLSEEEKIVIKDGPPSVNGWSLSRQRSVVTLFGEGMTRCIPDDTKGKLTKPLCINKALSVSELGSGLGGFTRWVSSEYDAYVTGYEADEALRDSAAVMTKDAGLHRKVKFLHCDFNNLDPKPRSADVVYASEALFTVKDKAACFAAIFKMLKPAGQFMMSDYMLEGIEPTAPELKPWQDAEPIPANPIDVEETRRLLTEVGFEISIAENVTAEYKSNVLKSFADYATRTGNGEKSGHLHEWILNEGELWMRRIKMMDAGNLKVFRIYARKPFDIK
ncbi:class I SAM-dependent methyltransferase [Sneathiella litorea]|uniref:Methyltransferase domain-containing protein n=1 Tax=Sneathiella litorea TaxID=2606216 RepID=A0A6L8WD08_9PROT|nr:class I SAM-dependent methyltransferase [Sneathiella litorea]MZR32027.1 methyltransferase domain-containing protein [Sneathiella litorea]